MNAPHFSSADFERLSALMDGELSRHEAQALLANTDAAAVQAHWQACHVIGDALRDSAVPLTVHTPDLLTRLRQQMSQDSLPPALAASAPALPEAAAQEREAANDPAFLRRMGVGLASLAAVAILGWSALGGLTVNGSTGVHMAQQYRMTPEPGLADGRGALAPVNGAQPGVVMWRDPQLDALLAAHRQNVSPSALGVPAGFLQRTAVQGSAP